MCAASAQGCAQRRREQRVEHIRVHALDAAAVGCRMGKAVLVRVVHLIYQNWRQQLLNCSSIILEERRVGKVHSIDACVYHHCASCEHTKPQFGNKCRSHACHVGYCRFICSMNMLFMKPLK